jgi:hypothetical protein
MSYRLCIMSNREVFNNFQSYAISCDGYIDVRHSYWAERRDAVLKDEFGGKIEWDSINNRPIIAFNSEEMMTWFILRFS